MVIVKARNLNLKSSRAATGSGGRSKQLQQQVAIDDEAAVVEEEEDGGEVDSSEGIFVKVGLGYVWGVITLTRDISFSGVPAEKRQEGVQEEDVREARGAIADLQRSDHLQRSAVHAEHHPDPVFRRPDDQPDGEQRHKQQQHQWRRPDPVRVQLVRQQWKQPQPEAEYQAGIDRTRDRWEWNHREGTAALASDVDNAAEAGHDVARAEDHLGAEAEATWRVGTGQRLRLSGLRLGKRQRKKRVTVMIIMIIQ